MWIWIKGVGLGLFVSVCGVVDGIVSVILRLVMMLIVEVMCVKVV